MGQNGLLRPKKASYCTRNRSKKFHGCLPKPTSLIVENLLVLDCEMPGEDVSCSRITRRNRSLIVGDPLDEGVVAIIELIKAGSRLGRSEEDKGR